MKNISSAFLDGYSHLWELVLLICKRKPIPVDIISAIGGRFSGKTTNYAMRFFIVAATVASRYGIKIGAVYNRASVQGIQDS